MLKAIFAKHVQAGDEILASGGDRIGVHHTEVDGAIVRIYVDNSFYRTFCEYDVVGLGHRPSRLELPRQFLAVAKLLKEVVDPKEEWLGRAFDIRDMDSTKFPALREALEAYELGKPEVKS